MKMKIHKEGLAFLRNTLLIILVLCIGFLMGVKGVFGILLVVAAFCLLAFLWFFRNPVRNLEPAENVVYAPADGKIVVVEQTYESEYLHRDCIQVSIFMSPLNVHVNRYPVGGKVLYVNHSEGSHKIAHLPKSSHRNERNSVVIETVSCTQILMRQIAGAMARRIVCYARPGDIAVQGEDMGFIKFGSRVDLFLPLDADIQIDLEDTVRGNNTVIATLPSGAGPENSGADD